MANMLSRCPSPAPSEHLAAASGLEVEERPFLPVAAREATYRNVQRNCCQLPLTKPKFSGYS